MEPRSPSLMSNPLMQAHIGVELNIQALICTDNSPDPHDALLNMLSDVNIVTVLTSGIEDNHSDEYVNIIKHMQIAIQPPPVVNAWFSWLKSLGQGWPAWFLTMIIPYVMIFFLL